MFNNKKIIKNLDLIKKHDIEEFSGCTINTRLFDFFT
jgi:hypothetical protein